MTDEFKAMLTQLGSDKESKPPQLKINLVLPHVRTRTHAHTHTREQTSSTNEDLEYLNILFPYSTFSYVTFASS